MPNMGKALSQHNAKLARSQGREEASGCTGRDCCAAGGAGCPLQGNCKVEGVVYGATVTDESTGDKETYTGLTEGRFKTRFNSHAGNFRNRNQQHKTTLSTHVWKLKDMGRPYRVTWTILARARGFNTSTGVCRLCLVEKFFIMFHRETASLNSRREIYSSCRHRRGKLLANS